jgi:hypothetical protein
MYAKILLMTVVLLSGQTYAQTTDSTKPDSIPTVKMKKKKKLAKTAVIAPLPQTVEIIKKEEPKKTDLSETNIAPTTIPDKVLKYLKEKFSASYYGEFYFVRRDINSANVEDHAIQDLNYMHNPTLIYKPTNNWQVSITGEFKYRKGPGKVDTYVNDYYRALLNITRKNILVEKEVGIQLDAGIGRRDYNSRFVLSNFGNSRIFATITKSYGKSNGSLFAQYLFNDPIVSSAKTWTQGLEIIPTINLQLTEKLSYLFNDDINLVVPKYNNTYRKYSITHEMNLAYLSYQWTDKISTYYQFKYLHAEDFSADPKIDYFDHYAGLAYAFTPKFMLQGEIGGGIFRSNKDNFISKNARYPELALYINASI